MNRRLVDPVKNSVNSSTGSMLIAVILLVLLAGAAIAIYHFQKGQIYPSQMMEKSGNYTTQMSPSPSDDLSKVDQDLSSLDSDLKGADSSMNDKPGDLSEQ